MTDKILEELGKVREQRGIDVEAFGIKGKIGIPNEPKLTKFKDIKLPRF